MKLIIKNFKNIVGQKLGDWVIGDVVESNTYYSFLCRPFNSPPSQYGHIQNVRLIRDGVKEIDGWKYRFWHPANYGTYSQVTADWFSDMRNACKVIEQELKRDFNK